MKLNCYKRDDKTILEVVPSSEDEDDGIEIDGFNSDYFFFLISSAVLPSHFYYLSLKHVVYSDSSGARAVLLCIDFSEKLNSVMHVINVHPYIQVIFDRIERAESNTLLDSGVVYAVAYKILCEKKCLTPPGV
jgi:hypothetical protein